MFRSIAVNEKPRRPARIWKWTRRLIVTLFLLLILLVSAILIYAAVVNHQGKEAIESALADVRARGLPLDRKQIYDDAGSGDDEAGHLYLAAFELTKVDQDKYDDLPYIGSRFRSEDMPLCKPLDPKLVGKIRAFAEENKRYFALLEDARSRNARIPLLDFYSWNGSQLSHLSSSRAAAKRWLLLSLLAQAEGKDAEAMQACAKAIETNRIFDGQPLILTGLVRIAVGELVSHAVEDTLSRVKPDPKDLRDLRDILLAEDACLDPREILKGELALVAETAADPDLRIVNQMSSVLMLYTISKQFRESPLSVTAGSKGIILEDARIFPRTLCVQFGISWLWQGICPGVNQKHYAREIRNFLAEYDAADVPLSEQAQRAKRLKESDEMQEGGFTSRWVQLLLQGKASLRAAAIAMSVETWRIQHQGWPEKLADVAADFPMDPFTGKPMKYKRTEEGCVIYSVGKNLQDDGGKDHSNDGDDTCFRLFDVAKRNKP